MNASAQKSAAGADRLPRDIGAEALAYSAAVQAFVVTLPLVIVERERARREHLTESASNQPTAPINQIGHMARITVASREMPYSPNNDTVYSGALLDLRAEPMILHAPDIFDRYCTFQMADAYIKNTPYTVSTRVNGGKSANVALVGPNWTGELPEGMPVVRFPTLYGLIAARIRVDNQDDADSIVAPLHKQTTLSDWKGGPDKLAMPPAPLNRPVYTDEFAYFRRAAELMTECPPMAADAAAVEIMKRIGMEAGKPFDPDALDANVRAGVLRAAHDIPAMTDAIRLTRGIETPNRWRTK